MKRDYTRKHGETLAQWIDRITPAIMLMQNRYDVQELLLLVCLEAQKEENGKDRTV